MCFGGLAAGCGARCISAGTWWAEPDDTGSSKQEPAATVTGREVGIGSFGSFFLDAAHARSCATHARSLLMWLLLEGIKQPF